MSKDKNKGSAADRRKLAAEPKDTKDNSQMFSQPLNDTTIDLKQHQSTHEQLKNAMLCHTNQRKGILKYLMEHESSSTLGARQAGTMSPAARVKELRQFGHEIKTIQLWGDFNGMAVCILTKLAVADVEVLHHE